MTQVEKIKILKKGVKAMRRRTTEHPEMAGQPFYEIKEMRQVGKPVKRWWFVRRAKQILNEKFLNPDHEF